MDVQTEASGHLFASPASPGSMSDESEVSTVIWVGENGGFVSDFFNKFRNTSISTETLVNMAAGPHAAEFLEAEPSKIWLAPIAGMSREDFSFMRFLSISLDEFSDLVLFGSLNEVVQVHATLAQRKQVQLAQMAPVFLSEFGKHPGECLFEKWHPEAEKLETLYKCFTSKMRAYMGITTLENPIGPIYLCHSYSDCDDDHRLTLALAAKKACCIVVSPTVWQQTDDEEDEIKNNMQQILNKGSCKVSEIHFFGSL